MYLPFSAAFNWVNVSLKEMIMIDIAAPGCILLKIDGKEGEISLHSLLTGIQCQLSILADLDVAISGQSNGSLDWVITDLKTGSLSILAESRSRFKDFNVGQKVAECYIQGIRTIEEKGTTPPFFPENSLKMVKRMATMLGKNGATGLEISSPCVKNELAHISAKAVRHVAELLPTRYSSIGSIDGKMEMISLHKKPKFVVYHSRTQRAVSCIFLPDMLDQVKELLGKRVNVSGTVFYNTKSEPLRVDLTDIRLLRDQSELPTIDALLGIAPDLTGKLDAIEYLRRVRSG